MEQKNITMSDMILKIIQENQLFCAEEDMVWEIMEKRRRERIKAAAALRIMRNGKGKCCWQMMQ